MGNLAVFYQEQEPVDVVRFARHDRTFVVYDQAILTDLCERAAAGERSDDLYKETCARVLAGDPDVRALPKDSPPWYCVEGKWRPLDGT